MVKVISLVVFALVAAMGLPSLGAAQGSLHDLPTHAHYSASGQGWTCDDGFNQVAGYCMADSLDVPSQGPFEVFDGQWRCRSGYQPANGFCVPLTAPAHATLVGDGDRWECDWGFRKIASRCEEISPPAHAYIDASGSGWTCFPGFERISDHCIALPSTTLAPPPAPADQDSTAPSPKQ